MRRLCFAILMSVVCGVAVAQTDEEQALHIDLMVRIANADGDPLSDAATADLLDIFQPDSQTDPQRQRALASARNRLRDNLQSIDDVAVLALRLMKHTGESTDSAQRAMDIAKLENESERNAFYALVLLPLAEYRDHPDAIAALLHRAAQAPRYESLSMLVTRSLYSRILQQLPPDGALPAVGDDGAGRKIQAFALATNASAVSATPAYQSLLKPCAAAVGPMRADCRRIADRMTADADAMVDAMIGRSLLLKLADTDAERAQQQNEQRDFQWFQEQSGQLNNAMVPEAGEAWSSEQRLRGEHFSDAALEHGEILALRQAVADAQMPEHPPSDWKPYNERAQVQPAQPE